MARLLSYSLVTIVPPPFKTTYAVGIAEDEKRNRDSNNFDTETLSQKTEGYTGADIEQIIKLGLKIAFFESNELSTKHLLNCIKEIIPLSKTEGERISAIRNWCSRHAKPANQPSENKFGNTRKVSLN